MCCIGGLSVVGESEHFTPAGGIGPVYPPNIDQCFRLFRSQFTITSAHLIPIIIGEALLAEPVLL